MAHKKANLLLYACFLLSGIAGLVYEVVWAKYLSILFGNTTYAYTIVLATFMGGLALGSFSLGRLADRMRDRLALYALVEIGIALYCAFTPRLFALSKNIYLAAARTYAPNSPALTLVMFLIGAAIMLLPTVLMGGTLPILSVYTATSPSSRGKTVARLYYINSLGAVIGTILTGYYLIHHFGLGLTLIMAAFVNLLVGAIVLVMRWFLGSEAPGPETHGEEIGPGAEVPAGEACPGMVIKISLFAIFASGFAAMLYELVWVRLLSLVLGSSTYSFSVMLAAFISGITIGSFLISRFAPGGRAAFALFGLCEACIGLFLIVSIPFYEKLPYVFLRLSGILSRKPETFMLYETAKLCVSFLVMLPPTVFLGMTVPLASIIASRRLELFGRSIGSVFSLNTTGNILGALATGLVLIPALGLQQSLELGILINLGLGILILCTGGALSSTHKIGLSLLCCAAFVAYKTLIPDWNNAHFTVQAFRKEGSTGDISPAAVAGDRKVLYYKDGLNATVAVVDFGRYRTLFVNGKADASTGNDMPTQTLLAALPLVLKPATRDIMVIGIGSGVTCGTAMLFPVRSVDAVELSPEVVDAAAYFAQVNHNVLSDPRLHLHIEDGKTFIQRTDKKYDLIISEPSNPWISGVGDLFSIEHLGDCRRALREGGVMVQWVQGYEMDDDTFKIIVKTFCSVFPEVTLWSLMGNDILLMGTRSGLKPDFDASEKIMASPAVRENLARVNRKDLFTLLCLQLGSSANVRGSVQSENLVNRDFFPLLEYRAPRALYTKSFVRTYLNHLDERRFSLEKYDLLLKHYLRSRRISNDNLRNLLGFLESELGGYNTYLALPVLDRLHRALPGDRGLLLAYLSSGAAPLQENILQVEKLIADGDRDFEFLDLYASLLIKRYFMLRSFLTPELVPDTLEKLKRCAGMAQNRKAKFYYLMGKVCLHNRDYQKAFSYYRESDELARSEHAGAPAAP